MSNILILFSSSEIGGTEKSLSRMAFMADDDKYIIGTLGTKGPLTDWISANGSSTLVYGNANFFLLAMKLFRDIKRLDINIVYVCGLRASFLLRFLLVLIPSTKLIHAVRWNPCTKSLLDKSFRMVEICFSWLVDGWIVNSNVIKKTLVSRCNIKKDDVYVIYNGVNFQICL